MGEAPGGLLSMVFLRQEHWSGLPFPSPVNHVLSELFRMTCPSGWLYEHGMAHSFIEFCKPLHRDKAVVHEGDVMCILSEIFVS